MLPPARCPGRISAALCALLAVGAPGHSAPSREAMAPGAARPGWLNEARHCLEDKEFELGRAAASGPEAGTWQAPNRPNRLRTFFTPEGIRLVPREDPSRDAWSAGWALVSASRDGLAPAAPPRLVARGARIEFRREAGPLEWYENGPAGLRYGVVFESAGGRAASSHGDPGRAVIALRPTGSLSPRLARGESAVDFVRSDGRRVLLLDRLRAQDARDRALPARYALSGAASRSLLLIVVDARGAVEPVRVDATLTASGWSAEADQAEAGLGMSVAAAGDLNGDGFADLIVAAPRYDHGEADEGGAFVYLGSAAGPGPAPDWSAEGDRPGALFGSAVASAGDVNGDGFGDLIIGAPSFPDQQTETGRVFVYFGSPSGPVAHPAWTAEGDQPSADFGAAVASAGDVNGDGFDDILVGAPRHDAGRPEEGGAFLYRGSPSGPQAIPGWAVVGGRAGAHLGASVATAGDVDADGFADLLVGAPDDVSGSGRVDLYRGAASGPAAIPSWSVSSDQPGSRFGFSVASAGDVNGDGYADVLVGAPDYDDPEENEGHAFLFPGSPAGPGPNPAWLGECNQPFAGFGTSVAGVGDVNGDGFDDLLVGVPRHDEGALEQGVGFLYLGAPAGPPLNPDWTAIGGQVAGHFGRSVAAAGDVNGDGFADLLIGAPDEESGEPGEGRAFLFYGGPPCSAPGLAVTIAGARMGEGTRIVLDIEDPNPPGSVTGYDVFRSPDAAAPPFDWQRVGAAIVDEDRTTPGIQWNEEFDAVPAPGSAWFYRVDPVNDICGAP